MKRYWKLLPWALLVFGLLAVAFALLPWRSPDHQPSARILEGHRYWVQHLAFATGDIFATVQRLERNRVELLQIPENYYDDLEAKTDLAPERLAALKAHNILYDRDSGGEYFQAYTQSFEHRFFFEIVERRGYGGYGAANAPVRLAAQARLVDAHP